MSQCAACSERPQILSPCLFPAASSPSGSILLPKGLCPGPGKSLTRESSFPVAMAMADSKQPVVEKVQQLPQGPYMRKGRGTALGGAAGSPKPWGTGAWQRAEPALPAGSWAWLSAQPLPRARGRHRMAQGELSWGRGSQHCSLPTATNHRTSLTWFFTGVTKFPFFLQSMESGEGPELRRKLPLVAEQFCKPGRGCVGCQARGPQ